jgi:hypothetical protein
MQAERVAQETPMPEFVVVTTCRTLATVHFVPFQVSTRPRISSFFTGSNDPAATQNVGDRQDTATSELRKLPAGTAARPIGLHVLPFQAEYVGLFRFAAVIPTARQNDGEVHDSACMPLSPGLGCPGEGAGAQCWPSHRSAPAAEPRARQKVADGQDRLPRKPWLALAGYRHAPCGDGRTATDGSLAGTSKFEPAPDVVAAQKPAPAQDTWFSSPPAVPGGSGTGWAVKTPPFWLRRANAVPPPRSSPWPSVASLAPTSVQPEPWQFSPKGMSSARSLTGFGMRKPPVTPRDAVHQASSSP